MTDIVIAGALRTAIGKFGGSLAKMPAPDLGATVIRALLDKTKVAPDAISEVIIGQVLTAFRGVLTGTPEYLGRSEDLMDLEVGR